MRIKESNGMNTSTQQHPRDTGRRSKLYRFTAVTLRHVDLGETDRIVTIFSEQYGKQRLLAKGVRRPGNRNAGAMEPFTLVHGTAVKGRSLDIVTQVDTVRSFNYLRSTESLIARAGLFADLLDSLTLEDQPHKPVFDLTVASLDLLTEKQSPLRTTLVFEYGLLRELGYRPELRSCLRCGTEVEPVVNGFHFEEGGVLCERCARASGAESISVPALKILRLLDAGAVRRIFSLTIPHDVLLEVDALLAGYIRSISGRESTARQVIHELGLEYDANA